MQSGVDVPGKDVASADMELQLDGRASAAQADGRLEEPRVVAGLLEGRISDDFGGTTTDRFRLSAAAPEADLYW